MVWLHCISLFMVPESIFRRDNNVGRYFSFVMWRPKKKIKIGPFVPLPGSQAVDREGPSWDTCYHFIFHGLTCPHHGDREAGSRLARAPRLPPASQSLTLSFTAQLLHSPTPNPAHNHRASHIIPFCGLFLFLLLPPCWGPHHSLLWMSLGQAGSDHVPPSFPGLPDFTDKPKPCGLYLGAYGRDCFVSTKSVSFPSCGHSYKLHFPASPAVGCGHVTEFWPMECVRRDTRNPCWVPPKSIRPSTLSIYCPSTGHPVNKI